jgi:hypothetical protein
LLLRTASAISRLFIRASNQQSDQDIARSLQFCDSRGHAIRLMILELPLRSNDAQKLSHRCRANIARRYEMNRDEVDHVGADSGYRRKIGD